MLHGMRPFLLLTVTLIALHAAAAPASAPRCTPQREGEAACLDGKLCECRHDPGGTLTGRRPGARWNCGVLRPSCGTVPVETERPADRAPPPLLPPTYPPPEWR